MTSYAYSKKEEPPVSSYTFMNSYYDNLVEPSLQIAESKTVLMPSYGSEVQDYQDKISMMTQELTKNSLDKGEMIMEVAELNRKNRELTKEKEDLQKEK